MSGTMISIATPDGDYAGYLARPGVTGTGPGVIVIQEIFGVNTEMRRVCDWLAKEGFVALCPDLFWRVEPGVSLTDDTEEEWGRAFALMKALDLDKAVADVDSAVSTLRARPECEGKVGAVGYCLGGRLAFLASARTDVDAAVGYYGVGIEGLLDDHPKTPLMLHVAGKDQFSSAEAQAKVAAGVKDNANVTLHTYPDRDHAFARVGGDHYDAKDAATADGRTLAFFRDHLK